MTNNLENMESISVLDCQFCCMGSAVAQCIECYRDDQESLLCPDCLIEHLADNYIQHNIFDPECQICDNPRQYLIKFKFSEQFNEQELMICEDCKEELEN